MRAPVWPPSAICVLIRCIKPPMVSQEQPAGAHGRSWDGGFYGCHRCRCKHGNDAAPILQQALQQSPNTAGHSMGGGSPAPAVNTASLMDSSTKHGGKQSIEQIQETLRQVGKQLGWSISESGSEWTLSLSLGPLRKQDVHVDFSGIDEAGHRLVSIWSTCGVIEPSMALTLLRYNAQIVHGAFAVNSIDGSDVLVIRGNLLADTADLLELTRTITAVAWQANQAEQQLAGHAGL